MYDAIEDTIVGVHRRFAKTTTKNKAMKQAVRFFTQFLLEMMVRKAQSDAKNEAQTNAALNSVISALDDDAVWAWIKDPATRRRFEIEDGPFIQALIEGSLARAEMLSMPFGMLVEDAVVALIEVSNDLDEEEEEEEEEVIATGDSDVDEDDDGDDTDSDDDGDVDGDDAAVEAFAGDEPTVLAPAPTEEVQVVLETGEVITPQPPLKTHTTIMTDPGGGKGGSQVVGGSAHLVLERFKKTPRVPVYPSPTDAPDRRSAEGEK